MVKKGLIDTSMLAEKIDLFINEGVEFAQWPPLFIVLNKPSIEYLELYALTAALITWADSIQNQRIVLFCDNMSVVNMINNMASSCKNCMYLLRLISLNNLLFNRRLYAKHVRTADNYLSDALSRRQFTRFWRLAPKDMNKAPTEINSGIWPITKIWMNNFHSSFSVENFQSAKER